MKNVLLKILENLQENTFLIKALSCNFIKKETLTQVLSCESCEIFKNTFLHRTPPVAASKLCLIFSSAQLTVFIFYVMQMPAMLSNFFGLSMSSSCLYFST